MRSEGLTVSRDHFLSHVAGARSCDVDLEPIFERAGVTCAILQDGDARIEYEALNAVRLDVCRLLDDENGGFFEVPARWGSTVYFCRAIVTSRTLREALYRYERFSAILINEVRVRVVEGPEETAVELDLVNRKGIDIRGEIENRIFFLLSFSLWLTDKWFSPRAIHFAFARPPFAADYSEFVPCPYVFDQPVNRLVLDSGALREPVRRSPRLLNQFLETHLSYLVSGTNTMSGVAERVRRLVEVGVSGNADLASVSEALGIAQTTLRRRLKSEGCSFQVIKDQVRKTRAIRYLTERRLTVAETAALTGFSDPAAFSRAFKTWTGSSPSDYGRAK
jgi:AraC-like DNA-binding protein